MSLFPEPHLLSFREAGASLGTQWFKKKKKNPSAMQETQYLGQEDPLEEEMATHSSILTWEIPWTEEPDSLLSWSCKESDSTE